MVSGIKEMLGKYFDTTKLTARATGHICLVYALPQPPTFIWLDLE